MIMTNRFNNFNIRLANVVGSKMYVYINNKMKSICFSACMYPNILKRTMTVLKLTNHCEMFVWIENPEILNINIIKHMDEVMMIDKPYKQAASCSTIKLSYNIYIWINTGQNWVYLDYHRLWEL